MRGCIWLFILNCLSTEYCDELACVLLTPPLYLSDKSCNYYFACQRTLYFRRSVPVKYKLLIDVSRCETWSVSLLLCVSVSGVSNLSIYRCLSVCLSVCLSLCQSVSVCVSVGESVSVSVCLWVRVYLCLCVCG